MSIGCTTAHAIARICHGKHCLSFQARRCTVAPSSWLQALCQSVLGMHMIHSGLAGCERGGAHQLAGAHQCWSGLCGQICPGTSFLQCISNSPWGLRLADTSKIIEATVLQTLNRSNRKQLYLRLGFCECPGRCLLADCRKLRGMLAHRTSL